VKSPVPDTPHYAGLRGGPGNRQPVPALWPAPLPDILYLDTGRDTDLITGTDQRIAEYADDFEVLLESALPADQSIEFIRGIAEGMS
jgi:hypothetical protein